MKNYTITVNGNVYDVTVEENGSSEQLPQRQQHLQRHRKQQHLHRRHLPAAPAPEAPAAGAGSIQVKAGACRKSILSVEGKRRSGCKAW